LATLLTGPNRQELDSRLQTAIPTGTTLKSARASGNVLFADVTEEINDLTGEQLTLAVAQIVFTASEIPGIQVIRLRVNGEDQAWPKGDGQTRLGDLRVYDFPGFAASVQPAFPVIPT
jgi:spore germination protein GerM